ncbi:MAG: peroxiredoxin family protein [Acidimicrobiales bacterium]
MPLAAGDTAPSFTLTDARTGRPVSDPWRGGPVVLAFFKVTCPVCQMVAPTVQAVADGGARVVAVGQDPPDTLAAYAARHGQHVPTLSEPPPYRVSTAYRITAVPTIFLVGDDGVVCHAAGSWDRERWNALAVAAGGRPVSADGDGLPSFRPG